MKKYIIILTSLFFFNSCYDDFLQNEPLGMSDFETLFKDPAQTKLALYGVYDMMQGHSSYDRNFWMYGDLMSGDSEEGGKQGCADEANVRPYHRFAITSSDTYLSGFYSAMYVGIQRANNIINFAKPIDAEFKNYIAEAKVLRAMFYFDLVRVFGPVIYVSAPINFADAKDLTNRQVGSIDDDGTEQVKMIYTNLVADLEASIPDLTLTITNGYITKSAAQGLLAKIYAFRYSWTKDNKDLEKSLALVNALYAIKGNPTEKYPDIFSETNELNTESLIEVQFEDSKGYNKDEEGEGTIRPIDQSSRYIYENTGAGWLPNTSTYRYYGLNVPTLDLVKSFSVDAATKDYDPRLEMIAKGSDVLFPGSLRDSMLYKPAQDLGHGAGVTAFYPIAAEASQTGFYLRKAEPRGGNADFTSNSQAAGLNHILLRYSDVLLIGAEAAMELGQEELALKYVNAVRKRARESKVVARSVNGTFTYGVSELPKDYTISDFSMDDIRAERRLELYCEGQRFFDLVRWGIADEVLGALKTDGCGVAIAWKSHNKVLPFPLNQVLQHGGKLVQNEGYN